MRMLTAAEEDGRAVQFVEAMLPAIWEDGVDITNPETLGAAITEAGFDVARCGGDPIFIRDSAARAYVPLIEAVRQGLSDGSRRL